MESALLVLIVLIILLVVLIIGNISSREVVKTNFSKELIKTATVYYYLPESLIKINSVVKVAVTYNTADNTLNDSTKIIEQTFSTSSEIVADTKELLSLCYKPNIFMADDIKYCVNSKGLLETVDVTTEDKTSAIVTSLAAAPHETFGNLESLEETPIRVVIKEYSADFFIKFSSITETENSFPWNIIIVNEFIPGDFLPLSASFKLSSKDNQQSNKDVSEIFLSNKSIKAENNEINGILTRPLKNIQISFKSDIKELNNHTLSYIVVVDNSKLINIPVNRTAFAKRVNQISIVNGVIESNIITNPSSVEGFVTIPISIAKSIVSIPARLITFRYDNITRNSKLEGAKLDYEKAIISSQKLVLSKHQEMESFKLEVQKSLLESGKGQLEALKALDELKKEIAKLKK